LNADARQAFNGGAVSCLYLVSTPIGNLGDVTRRAVEVLGAVTLVVAEDTRRTRALLSHLAIASKEVRSLNANSSPEAVAQLVERLEAGTDIAFVTDAGTPAVSDPGRALVNAAAARGLEVRVVPGASAVTAAVALSGLVEGPFTFLGFLPRSGGGRRAALERIRKSEEASVIFESPVRLAETLVELAGLMPERAAFVGRELTKLHEEGLRASVRELAARTEPWRGEIVLVIAGAEPRDEDAVERRALVDACLRAALECGANPSHMARALAEASRLPRRELYARALEISKELSQSSPDQD
jgi:16S rRNA (cytidine1402-2'-O)-methyltransferase